MNSIEDRIREATRAVADQVSPVVPDAQAVASGARSRRRHRRLALAAATAAAAVVGALGAGLLPHPGGPGPAKDDRGGEITPRSGAVWYDVEGLHLGNERVIRLAVTPARSCPRADPLCEGLTALSLVRDGVVYGDEKSKRVWYQPWNGAPEVIGSNSELGPAGDTEGSVAVWFEGSVLVAYDTATGEELARAPQPRGPIPQRENANGNSIAEVTPDSVTWMGDRFYRYDITSSTTDVLPTPATRMSAAVGGVDASRGLVAGFDDRTSSTTVLGPGRRVIAAFKDHRVRPPLQFSADGRFLAGVAGGPYGAIVADLADGQTFLPSRHDSYPTIGWGYGDSLAVIQNFYDQKTGKDLPGDRLLTCHVKTRRCTAITHDGPAILPGG